MTTNGSPTIDHKTACTWLLVAAWTALILWAGSGSYSAANTSRFLLPLVRWLLPDALFQTHWQLMIFARKAAHVVEYAVLAWLCWLALRATLHNALLRIAGLALIWVIAVASFDEVRQSTLASRSGSGFDVALDVFGGVLALTLAIAYTRRMRRKREPVAGG